MKNFRPISLCNILMKIITKVLANRIKDYMHVIISEQQSAFVRERLISDNIGLAHEIMHNIRHKKQGVKGFLAVKIDMSKSTR